jgi:glycosyltransferase involved in cell wall biosynthesis
VSDGKRLRVLSIAHPAVSKDGGRLRYNLLASRDDIDVHLLVPAVWQEFGRTLVADPATDPRLKLHILPIRFPRAGPMNWYLHFYPGLRRLISEIDPDVIHLWEEPWSVVAMQARILKGRAAMVLEVDQNILKRLPPPFEAMRKHVLRRTGHVLSRSPDATDVVRANGYGGPVSPIGYGVDQSIFFPAAKAAPVKSSLRIGYVGRLIEEKGLDDALDALAQTGAGVSLAIMGEGPYERMLRQRIVELGLESKVTIRGWDRPAAVGEFMRSLDLMILLTRTTKSVREQFGRVIVESQACGVAVIGSQCGAIPDVIGDGGWIIPEQDPGALATLLDEIAANPALLGFCSAAAQRNVATRFTYAAVADAMATACAAAAASRFNG